MSVAVELWRAAESSTGSAALDLWRALEARHNLRGPDGRFIKGPGGGSDRPSLADVIRGTAALGPKRQRGDKGGMSVADAVRSAARRSDTTGRPTQRTPEEHRAHGAHDVADEVDRALAEAGVPEDVRRQVADRARAVADEHGPRPGSKPKKAAAATDAPSPSLPVVTAAEQQRRDDEYRAQKVVRAKTAVRDAVANLQTKPGAWVSLTRVRNELGESHNRDDVDAALREIERDPDVNIVPESNRKTLTDADRFSAVVIGMQDKHLISIQPPRDAPARAVSPGEAAIRDAYARVPHNGNGWVKLADLRRELGDGQERATVDRDLDRMIERPDVTLMAELNQRSLTPAERAAAVSIGGEDRHLLKIGEHDAPPSRARRAPVRLDTDRLASVEGNLTSATSLDEARQHLAGLTVAQLRQLASFTQVPVGSGDTKARLADRIVNSVVGRRLDSDAIGRIVRS